MAEARVPRSAETREKMQRVVYVPPSTLPEPTPDPDKVFRWVSTHVMGIADPSNVSIRFRDGWIPEKANEHPEMADLINVKTGNIEMGGLMLCAMPRERAEARTAYYSKVTQSQMESVDNTLMKNTDSRMPIFNERKSEITRGAGFGTGMK